MLKIENHKIRKTLRRRILVFASAILSAFIVFLLVGTAVFYIYRDAISTSILKDLNGRTHGDFDFANVSVNFFVHFPYTSVNLHNISFRENPSDSLTNNDTIVFIENLYAAIDLSDLIRGEVDISRLTIRKGVVNVVRQEDSILNIIKAIRPGVDGEFKRNKLEDLSLDGETVAKSQFIPVNLNKIKIFDLLIKYADLSREQQAVFHVLELASGFNYQSDTIFGNMISEIELTELNLANTFNITDKTISVSTSALFDMGESLLKLGQSEVSIEQAGFVFSGYLSFQGKGDADLLIEGSDENFSLFRYVLSDHGMKHLQSGNTYLNGKIQGPFIDRIPIIDIDIGLQNVNLDIPDVNGQFSDLNVVGHINTGGEKDLSGLIIKISEFKGELPGGYINATFSIADLTNPEINLHLDMDVDVTGFNKVFNTNMIDSLSGRLRIIDTFIGTYDIEEKQFSEVESNSIVTLDSLSFSLRNMVVKLLDGEVLRSKDSLQIRSLRFITDNSDFFLEADMPTFEDYLIKPDSSFIVDLRLRSDTFDLPRFFAFAPNVGKSFPFRLTGMNMKIDARTSINKISIFNYNPWIDFRVEHLETAVENLFPPILISNGNIELSEKEERIHMKFYDFSIETAGANIQADVTYFSPPVDPDYVSVDASLNNFSPGALFLYDWDTIPSFLNGIMNGNGSCKFEIGFDTLDFESFYLDLSQMTYVSKKDTFKVRDLVFNGSNIYFSDNYSTVPYDQLFFDSDLKVAAVISNHFEFDSVFYEISSREGTITVVSEKLYFLGEGGSGYLVLSPFKRDPIYEMNYSVKGFPIDKFLTSFYHDTIITGNMDFDAVLRLELAEGQDTLHGLDGHIRFGGKDFMLYGADLDLLIKRFQRTQKFNLGDIGAVALAGPIGLAFSKGSAYANLAAGFLKDSTRITELSSEWEVKNGVLNLKDVAFATLENRVAAKGWIDLVSDSLDVDIAVLDVNGCSILNQTITGSIEDPEQSEIKVVRTLLAPITSLIKGALGKECEVFYTGKVEHPLKRKKSGKD